MLSDPLITALVSSYYAEKYVTQRLKNLFEQSVPIHVIYICQRGSREQELARDFPVEYLLTDDIPTLYDAWSQAEKRVKTPYVTSANTDDLYINDGARVLAELLLSSKADIVCGATQRSEKVVLYPPKQPSLLRLKKNYFLESMPMWRTSLHHRYGFHLPKYRVCGDYEFFLRCCMGGATIATTQEIVGYFPRHAQSLEHRQQQVCDFEYAEIRRKYA